MHHTWTCQVDCSSSVSRSVARWREKWVGKFRRAQSEPQRINGCFKLQQHSSLVRQPGLEHKRLPEDVRVGVSALKCSSSDKRPPRSRVVCFARTIEQGWFSEIRKSPCGAYDDVATRLRIGSYADGQCWPGCAAFKLAVWRRDFSTPFGSASEERRLSGASGTFGMSLRHQITLLALSYLRWRAIGSQRWIWFWTARFSIGALCETASLLAKGCRMFNMLRRSGNCVDWCLERPLWGSLIFGRN